MSKKKTKPNTSTKHSAAKPSQRVSTQAVGADLFERVAALAMNLHWSWSAPTQRLFAALDPLLWETVNHNPLLTLRGLSPARRATLAASAEFAALLNECEQERRSYLNTPTWFQKSATAAQKKLRVAYFCSEFSIHHSMPQYSGGLGVLAGDHLKSASDLGIPLVGIGLLYRRGYYRQEFAPDGGTRVVYHEYNPADWPVHDTGHSVAVELGNATLHARLWRLDVGRVPLYLLDADHPLNPPALRRVTHNLYGGDQETRIQQELLLGVGGVRALRALGLAGAVIHLNEGHAAFAVLERLAQARGQRQSWEAAYQRVRETTVFTTHTPVAAGHDRFPQELMKRYLSRHAEALELSLDGLMSLGRENPAEPSEPFCMTVLALSFAQRTNGVAALHGEVSREMWQKTFEADEPDEVPIEHITNGVHSETWLAPEIRPLYDKYLKPRWHGAGPDHNPWSSAARIPPTELWQARNTLRAKLVNFIRRRLQEQILRGVGPLEELIQAQRTFDEDALTIGFARRFATYKRAPLIFTDAKRLAAILNHRDRPVQLVFAGKAHPRDLPGQAFAQRVYQMARAANFSGRVVLLEEYDMHVGRMLTGGCDVWLNNPIRPMEASGTSGMKPPLHGGINCSILDGWWPEAYDGKNGWAIGDEYQLDDLKMQDKKDAQSLYRLLETEIVPEFYERSRDGLPRRWLRRALASMKSVCGEFNTHRMLREYLERYDESWESSA